MSNSLFFSLLLINCGCMKHIALPENLLECKWTFLNVAGETTAGYSEEEKTDTYCTR